MVAHPLSHGILSNTEFWSRDETITLLRSMEAFDLARAASSAVRVTLLVPAACRQKTGVL